MLRIMHLDLAVRSLSNDFPGVAMPQDRIRAKMDKLPVFEHYRVRGRPFA